MQLWLQLHMFVELLRLVSVQLHGKGKTGLDFKTLLRGKEEDRASYLSA